MVWLAENIQACLRDFLAATASMARKRHLASTARGFCCFCLMTLVTTGLIRPIRGEKKNLSSGVMPLTLLNLGCTRHSSSQLGSALICTRFQAAVPYRVYPGTPPPSVYQVTHGTALQAAECYVMHHSPYARCPFGTHLYGIPRYPGCRFAFPWAMSLQLLQGAW